MCSPLNWINDYPEKTDNFLLSRTKLCNRGSAWFVMHLEGIKGALGLVEK